MRPRPGPIELVRWEPSRPETHQNLIYTFQRTNNAEPSVARPAQIRTHRTRPAGANRDDPNAWLPCDITNGDDRDRTDDPLLAKQVLSQLSYAPVQSSVFSDQCPDRKPTAASLPFWPPTADNWIWGQLVWAREDLNLRPHAYQACALTN